VNLNLILALLEAKKVITHEEAEEVSGYLERGIQSSYYKDAQATIKKLLDTE
jgi:hypothetical protein